jgi:hypothetical protein
MKTQKFVGRIIGYASIAKYSFATNGYSDEMDIHDTGMKTVGFAVVNRHGESSQFLFEETDSAEQMELTLEKMERMRDDIVEVTYTGNTATRIKPFKPSVWFKLRSTLSSLVQRLALWLSPDGSLPRG